MDGPVMAGGGAILVGVGGKVGKGRWQHAFGTRRHLWGAAPNQEPPPPRSFFSPAARWTRDFFFIHGNTHVFFNFSILTFSTGGNRGGLKTPRPPKRLVSQNHLFYFLFPFSSLSLSPPSVPSGVVVVEKGGKFCDRWRRGGVRLWREKL